MNMNICNFAATSDYKLLYANLLRISRCVKSMSVTIRNLSKIMITNIQYMGEYIYICSDNQMP